jgi:hypothetical protein
MIKILQEGIIIIVAYKDYTESLAEEPTMGINIDQCFSLLYAQTVTNFVMHKKILSLVSLVQRCQAC